MSGNRVLVDTVFVQALLSARDQFHEKALEYLPRMRASAEVLVSEAVLIEVGDALCILDRGGASDWINRCYETRNIRVVSLTTELLKRALQLYEARPDKEWSLTDCISFVVMHDENLTEALTADRHFTQAGFRALMLEED